jgi:hypothetical protein
MVSCNERVLRLDLDRRMPPEKQESGLMELFFPTPKLQML